jgi:ornithine carbamoyltransferase
MGYRSGMSVDDVLARAELRQLHGANFLKELDFTPAQWVGLIDVAAALKAELDASKTGGSKPRKRMDDKNIALIFEKTSTRTRSSFEVAAHQQGAHTTYLDPAGSQLGHKESVADTARVLGRMFDGVEYRGFGQDRVEALATHAGVPVWNGLTDEWHPTQMLADQLTIREFLPSGKRIQDAVLAYLGDARSNVGNSILVAGAMAGMDVRLVAPAGLQPAEQVQRAAREVAERTGARLTVTDDLDAVEGADFLYTDVWVSMGEDKALWADRIAALRPYQVNAALLKRTGNRRVRVMHDLPAYHDLDTAIGRELNALTGMTEFEIADDVFEANADIIFEQAENRMHTIKAVMVATLASLRSA